MNPTAQPQPSMQADLSALKAVMAQSGLNGAALNQVTSQAPTAKPNMAPPMMGGNQSASITPPAGMSATQQAPSGMGLPAGDPEAQIIAKGLLQRLKTLGDQGR